MYKEVNIPVVCSSFKMKARKICITAEIIIPIVPMIKKVFIDFIFFIWKGKLA